MSGANINKAKHLKLNATVSHQLYIGWDTEELGGTNLASIDLKAWDISPPGLFNKTAQWSLRGKDVSWTLIDTVSRCSPRTPSTDY